MTENKTKSDLHYDSLVVQGVPTLENEYGAIMPPIFLSSTYRFQDLDHEGQYEYVRTQNPTREKAERLIARLEGARYGLGFSSGMAALATVFEHFKPGDRVISSANIYGGTYLFFSDLFTKNQIDYSLVLDLNHLTDADFTENTRAVYIETPLTQRYG